MTVEATPVDPAVVEPSTTPVENVSDAIEEAVTADPPAAPAEPVSDPPAEDETPPTEEVRKSRAQERIQDLSLDKRLLLEQNEFLQEALREALKGAKPGETAKVEPTPAKAPAEPEPIPTLEQFEYDTAKHAVALAAWVQKEIDRGVESKLTKVKQQEEVATQEGVIVKAAQKFRETHADFDLVLSNKKLQWSPTVLQALNEAGEESPALGYHLAQHPDKLAKIAKMKPTQQVMALGRLQVEIKAAAAAPKVTPTPPKTPVTPPKQKATTNAPPPPKPVSGAASPEVDPMSLHPKEWVKLRKQEIAESRKGQPRTVRSY